MAKQIKITTTGTQNPVVINDLGGRSFSHPTTAYNLILEYRIEDIINSQDLQTAITSGYITVVDEDSNNITNIANQIPWVNNIQMSATINSNSNVAAAYSHISNTSNPHSVTKSQVGLSNVTNDAQVKKISSSVSGNILTWNGITGDSVSDSGKAFNDSGTTANDIWSASKVNTVISNAVVGLLDYKGTIDCSTNPNYPSALKGDFYKISVAGKIGGASGVNVEVGDSIIANSDNAGGTQVAVGTSWDILQGNIDGAVTGPASSTDRAIALFNSTTGKVIQNSLVTIDVNGTINIPSGQTYNVNNVDILTTTILKSIGTTKGDTIVFTGNATPVRLPIGTNGYVLTANSGVTNGLEWAANPGNLKSYCWTAARAGNNITNSYLQNEGGVFTNTTPFIVPTNSTIVGISAATSTSKTWTPTIYINGTIGPTLTITSATKGQTYSLTTNVNAGDEISIYCNGTSITNPTVTVFLNAR